MGSCASIPKVSSQTRHCITESSPNGVANRGHLTETEQHKVKVSELEMSVKACTCDEVWTQNKEIQERMAKLEKDITELKQANIAFDKSAGDTRWSVIRDSTRYNMSESSPLQNDAEGDINPDSIRKISRKQSKQTKYSVNPVNDIEAYGQGLNLHELNQHIVVPSPKDKHRQSLPGPMGPSSS